MLWSNFLSKLASMFTMLEECYFRIFVDASVSQLRTKINQKASPGRSKMKPKIGQHLDLTFGWITGCQEISRGCSKISLSYSLRGCQATGSKKRARTLEHKPVIDTTCGMLQLFSCLLGSHCPIAQCCEKSIVECFTK